MVKIPCEIALPNYTITRYNDQIFKIVKFHRSGMALPGLSDHEKEESPGEKLSSNLSRARSVVTQIALCNEWDYFFTGTLDCRLMDRYDLREFNRSLSQWIRDMRKKYGSKIDFLLVPEAHKDGAWHMHGLLRGIPDDVLQDFLPGLHPGKLCFKGYKWWPDYSKKFGFCSLAKIKDPIACAFYIAKYITEDLSSRRDELGRHLYFASHGLNRACRVATLYGSYSSLDAYLQYDFDFCSVGMTGVKDGLDWTFPLQFEEFEGNMEALEDSLLCDSVPAPPEIVSMCEDVEPYLQSSFLCWS